MSHSSSGRVIERDIWKGGGTDGGERKARGTKRGQSRHRRADVTGSHQEGEKMEGWRHKETQVNVTARAEERKCACYT